MTLQNIIKDILNFKRKIAPTLLYRLKDDPSKFKKKQNELVSATTQLKLLAPDGKLCMADAIDQDGELYSKCIQLKLFSTAGKEYNRILGLVNILR